MTTPLKQNLVHSPWEALHYISPDQESILDVGCNAGEALSVAEKLGFKSLYGIEINSEAVEKARSKFKNLSHVKIFQGSADHLPIESGTIGVAICCEVLEHVPEDLRPKVIQEIHRVLKPGSFLILTVPFDGLFSFLDPSNVRFRIPKIYSFISSQLGGKSRDDGFKNQKHGVIWHHHFKLSELQKLLYPYFQVETIRWRSCILNPLFEWLSFPFQRMQAYDHFLFKAIKHIQRMDHSIQTHEKLAYNVLIRAQKL